MMSAEQLHASRAEQRKQRLLDVEREQAEEEAEALKMTEEQRQILLRPFQSVKAEFTDLDGMRWTQTALRRFDQPSTSAFVVLTNSDLASFSPDDTIRTRPPEMCRHRDGTKSRSPVKGLFTSRPPGLEPAPTYTESNATRNATAPHYTNLPRRRSSSSLPLSSHDSVSLLDQPITSHRRRDSDAPPPLNARVRLAALLSHSHTTPESTRPPPTPPILPSIITSLPLDSSTIRPTARRSRPSLPTIPAMTSRTTSTGLRGWTPPEQEDDGHQSREWDSDAEDDETPRPSPIEGGPVSPSRGWISKFS